MLAVWLWCNVGIIVTEAFHLSDIYVTNLCKPTEVDNYSFLQSIVTCEIIYKVKKISYLSTIGWITIRPTGPHNKFGLRK